jgi:hypothetical protein
MSFLGVREKVSGLLRMIAVVIALGVLVPAYSFAESVTVKASQVRVRSGAGNYYEVIYKVPRGTELDILEKLDGWYKISLPGDRTGFISRKSLERKTGRSRFGDKKWKEDRGVGNVASSEVMAATKGITEMGPFARKYAKKYDIDPGVLEQFNNVPFRADEYLEFRETLPQMGRVRIDGLSEEDVTDLDTEIGTAIALRLCQRGVSTHKPLRKYISMVGTNLVENTPLKYETFIFIVLESPKVESFALPGGYVFITKGAIELMKSEAELAGVLAHEVVHVVQRHGISELENQKQRIDSGSLMDNLDRELEDLGMDRGERELMDKLDEMADRMYEMIIGGRKIEAEDESDSFGTMLLYNSGYKAGGMKDFILSTGGMSDDKKVKGYSHRPHNIRARMIDHVIEKNDLSRKDRKVFGKRFVKNAI